MKQQLYTLFTVVCLALGLIGTSGLLAAAQQAGPPDNPDVVAAAQMPDGPGQRGDTLTIDNIDNPKTFNPIVQREASSSAVTSLLNDSLIDSTGKGAVAQAFDVSPDQTSVTLTLRKGIKFSDGTPVTADDVVFTLVNVVFNPAVNSAKDAWQVGGQFPTVAAVDSQTIKITAPVPFSGLLSAIASTPILPQHLLAAAVQNGNFNAAWGVTTSPNQIAGLGPFILKSFTPGQQVVLARNPYYWRVDEKGTQLPYVDQITMPIVTDDNVRLLRFSNGQSDIYPPRPEDVPVLRQKSSQGVSVQVQQAGTIDLNVIAFNQDVQDPDLQTLFRDVRFRQAMSYAANRQGMIGSNLNGLGEARSGPGIAAAFWIGDQPGFPSFDFNLQQAAQLLDQIGLKPDSTGLRHFADGKPVEFTLLTVQGSTVLTNDAVLYANDLAKIGVKADVRPLDLNAVIDQLVGSNPPQYQAARVSLSGGDGDPNLLRAIYESTGDLHFWKFSDGAVQAVPDWQKQVDTLLEQQAQMLDLSQRSSLLAQFQTIVAQNQPLIFLYNAQGLEAFRSDRVGNFTGTTESATLLNPEILFHK
jgi:peptide/nickel transport system substrate-binding protein